jgi:hypothetical protein
MANLIIAKQTVHYHRQRRWFKVINKSSSKNPEEDSSKLYNKIGKMQVEIDFLKEVLGK